MKRFTILSLIVGIAVLLAGPAVALEGRFTAKLTGADMRPPVDTETEGRFSIRFNEERTEAQIYFRVADGVGITEAHIHCADPRLNAPRVTTLFDLISEGDDFDGVERFILDNEDIAVQKRRTLGDAFLGSPCGVTNLRQLRQAIVSGGIYVDVHTVAHPAGEIRGQVSFFGEDTDGDGLRDARDPDIDGDGILNNEDPAPFRRTFKSAPPPRLGINGTNLVDEWFVDVPWHQKLSTKDSNLIDIPLVMPFDAIPFEQIGDEACKPSETDPIIRSRCILRYGIVNVMAMHRTDKLYTPEEAPGMCPDTNNNCMEVKLEISRLNTQNKNVKFQADEIKNNRYLSPDLVLINGNMVPRFSVISLGYAITEATMFSPWLPWYTGHYCAQDIDGVHDAVCYEDYFTTMIQATADSLEGWLHEFPDVFVPRGQEQFSQFCEAGKFSCDLFLGKVNWLKNGNAWATDPIVHTPPSCQDKNGPITPEECQNQVEDRTNNLVNQFNASITDERFFFDDTHHYPWEETSKSREELQEAIQTNPFIGAYDLTWDRLDEQGDPNVGKFFSFFTGKPYVLPKQCTPANYFGARQGNDTDINALKDCALDFEIHTNGFFEIWKPLFGLKPIDDLTKEAIDQIFDADTGFTANQYGRTMFMFAGVPEQHVAVSFKLLDDGISIHDKVYGSSLYTQYLPLVNPADLSLFEKSYTRQYWHSMLMSNHMNQLPDHFIRGIRGRTLWHNEYRSHLMYTLKTSKTLPGNKLWEALDHVDFPAGFKVANHKAPFHGNTCDSCHIRNGSGIPLKPNRLLPKIHQERGMEAGFPITLDETYSNTSAPPEEKQDATSEVPAMKMVLFDLGEKAEAEHLEQCDVNDHTTPTLAPQFYTNKIMNFYGNSLHVNQRDPLSPTDHRLKNPTYDFEYREFENGDGNGYEIVDTTSRKDYKTWYVEVTGAGGFGETCDDTTSFNPRPNNDVNWPTQCSEVNDAAIQATLNNRPQEPSGTTTVVGHMHLLGHRLGNSPLIEMIPNQTIIDTQAAQKTSLEFQGCFGLAAGTRGGGVTHYQTCESGQRGNTGDDCYISRFGWIGDRVSLEDQIANAASVEMNITSKESYASINPNPKNARELVRYKDRQCGPADKTCTGPDGNNLNTPNSDITEQEILDMATYQRWIGIPYRSEYQVSSIIVQKGEKVFKDLKCHSCHVIDKIVYVKDDNMLPDEERVRLNSLKNGQADYPFISYLGTDLLLHDMGYLSQVAKAPEDVSIRNADGTVKEAYKAWVQKIRTPALKGLRFNRFVTDSIHNTKLPKWPPSIRSAQPHPPKDATPACDFLLHDGRACDAIEAAYLHDGPAVMAIGMIKALNNKTLEQLKQLRAFLYSL